MARMMLVSDQSINFLLKILDKAHCLLILVNL
jgi:hypothetical protein